jgi:hypothetical protein
MYRNIQRVLLLICLVAAGGAYGQAFRAYLSSSGSDGNPCTLVQPCRLLPAALNAVAPGGEIWMLDSANFNSGTVNIGKSVSILALPGAVGSVVAVGGADAIDISGTGVKVSLRNLVIASNAVSPGSSGVVMSTGTSLSVDHCIFANLPHNGIDVETAAFLHVGDTLFRNIGTTGQESAILVANGASGEVVDTKIDTVTGFGLQVTSAATGVNSRATFVNSKVTHSTNCAVFSYISAGSGTAVLNTAHSALSNGNAGVCVQGGAGAIGTLDDVVIHGNTFGVYVLDGASIARSFGNNAITNNTTAFPGGAMSSVTLQ